MGFLSRVIGSGDGGADTLYQGRGTTERKPAERGNRDADTNSHEMDASKHSSTAMESVIDRDKKKTEDFTP